MKITLNPKLRESLSIGLNWLLPRPCIKCAAPLSRASHPCCEDCYLGMPFQAPSCQQCGQTMAADQDVCGRCLVTPPAYDACFCPFSYAPPVDHQIRSFKYHDRPELAKILAQLLSREIDNMAIPMPDVLLPVPMHTSRLRKRGYNQSLLLAQELGKILGIDVNRKALIKKHKTTPQADLNLKQRTKNLAGSFALRHPIEAKHVAIVDDVVTTGSTVAEIAKTLKRNGVDYVQIWGIAHTV